MYVITYKCIVLISSHFKKVLITSDYYDECMGRTEFDKIQQYVEMCEKHKPEAVDAYISLTCGDDLDGFFLRKLRKRQADDEEAYQGEWDSEEDFAEHLVEECYFDDLNGMSDLIRNNIDWRGVAREIFMDGYEYEDGVFLRKLRKRQADNVFYRR